MSADKPTTSARTQQTPIEIGQRFGRLVVIEGPFFILNPTVRYPGRRDAAFRCRCDCGSERTPLASNLRLGNTRSCGCLRRETTTKQLNAFNFRHGGARAEGRLPEYEAWCSMMKRCHNEKCKGYPNYGGRGIVVCERWRLSFLDFYADMGSRPTPKHSLDRIDCEGNYEPANCRWATRTVQNENRRSSVILEHNGQRMLIKGWAKATGIGKSTLSWRIRTGWSAEEALTTPPGAKRKSDNGRA